MVRVWLFGSVRLQVNEGEIVVPKGEPAQRLLAYLALRANEMVPTETVSLHIWDERVGDSYRQAKSRLLSAFRESDPEAGGAQLRATDGRSGRAEVGLIGDCEVDVSDFSRLLITDPEGALALCERPFLADISKAGPRLEIHRDTIAVRVSDLQSTRAQALFDAGQQEEALEMAERAIASAESHAPAAELAMRLYAAAGHRSAALGIASRSAKRQRLSGCDPSSTLKLAAEIEEGETTSPAVSQAGAPRERVVRGGPPNARRWPLAAAIGALTVGALGAVALVASSDKPEPGAHARCDRSTVAEPWDADLRATQTPASHHGSAEADADIVTRSHPRSIEPGADGIWLTQSTDGSVWRIDPKIDKPVGEPYPVGGVPFALALTKSTVWVTRDDGTLVDLNRRTGKVESRIHFGPTSGDVAVGDGWVWINIYDGAHRGNLAKIDPCTGDVEYLRVGGQANSVIFAFNAVWVTDSQRREVHRVDPDTGEVQSIPLDVTDPQDLTAGDGFIWVLHYGPKRVTRIDPETLERVGAPIEIGAGGAGIVVAAGAVWTANYEADSVSRIDLKTLDSDVRAVEVGRSPTDIAFGAGRLWVTNNDAEPPTVTPIRP